MRHDSFDTTMQFYTDPKLLDVRVALDSLPTLPSNTGHPDIAESARATGISGLRESSLAPNLDKRLQEPSSAVKTAGVIAFGDGQGELTYLPTWTKEKPR
jgi:hypothetical protein